MDRVAVGRLVVGHGENRKVIPAGERFDTRTLGIDDSDVARMEQRGVLRRPRDDIRVQAPVAGPGGGAVDEEEQRSPAPAAGEGDGKASEPGAQTARTRSGGRRKASDLDDTGGL